MIYLRRSVSPPLPSSFPKLPITTGFQRKKKNSLLVHIDRENTLSVLRQLMLWLLYSWLSCYDIDNTDKIACNKGTSHYSAAGNVHIATITLCKRLPAAAVFPFLLLSHFVLVALFPKPKGSCDFENCQNHSYLSITNCTRGRAISYTNSYRGKINSRSEKKRALKQHISNYQIHKIDSHTCRRF